MILKTVEHVQNLLKQNEKFVDKDGNIFIQNVLEAIEKIDRDLVKLLLSDEKTREQFFIKIDDVFVLEQNKLIEFFTMNEYFNNSFTSYTNKIGLIKKDSFIKKFDDVVLAWPHKDCVLEGGQSKDDEKNSEVFYNEILSREEIDRLFEPKALTNIKRYTKDGVEENPQIGEDDNLIIKGNNLIALHSLKKKYAGKVKLIYIDPPYNTGNDSFKYNDRFNHSTWLTFMKNRLEVAREFLSDDGVIFVQIDDNEQAYLKILMDEIFGNKNFISTVVNIVKPEGRRYGFIAQAHEYLLVYGKDISNTDMYEMTNRDKKLPYKDNKGNFDIVGLRNRAVKFFNFSNRPNLYYPFYVDANNIGDDGFMPVSTEPLKGYTEVLPTVVDNLQSVWRWGKEKAKVQSDEVVARIGNDGSIRIFKKDYSQTTMPTTFWQDKELITQKGTQQLDKLFDAKVFAFPKPEALLHRIIEISTKPNDLVMDFHLGSGTTCAVAHKMGRRYIGIEQMDYIEDIAVERMKKVLDGEQGGISKALEWKGGGSFIYAELKQIDNFKDAEVGKLNANMHYLPVSEIQDEDYDMSDDEIKINKAFYTKTGTSGLENE
jgi:adenine-specific DNA-methyltransferase